LAYRPDQDGALGKSTVRRRAGLAAAERFKPEVVLCDIGLPGLDGYQVAERLRASAESRDLLLVALTGYGQEEDKRRALQAGFDTYCVKPLKIELFEKLLSEL
jgi:CheY-like chemotaxis protein